MTDAVIETARRAGVDPFFLAYALAEYARRESLDEAALAAALGATPETLASARLCRMPRADPAGFREDVDRVAAKFGLDRDRLAAMAKYGQVTASLAADPTADLGTAPSESAAPFLAARDRGPS